MKQIFVFIPFGKCDAVSDNELIDYLFDKRNIINADHLGKRSGKRGQISALERFMERHPKDEWKSIVTKVSKISKDKARKQAMELADLESAKCEIDRIVSGYESEYIYLGKDMEKIAKIKQKYEAVYFALSNPVLSLDSISLMILKRR